MFFRINIQSSPEGHPLAGFLALAIFALIVLYFIAWCRIFRKAGMPWERMFVPFYNVFAQCDIADSRPLFWVNLALSFIASAVVAPLIEEEELFSFGVILYFLFLIVELIMLVIFARRLARNFGKGGWFTLGLVLLNPIFIMILGFGKAEYGYYPSSKDVVPTWECSSCGHQNPAYLRICEQCAKDKE